VGKVTPKRESGTFQRFHGTVEVDPQNPIGSFTEIVENIIEQFAAQYGTTLSITIDIEARRKKKFDLKTIHIVKENAATLKFKTAEFEEE